MIMTLFPSVFLSLALVVAPRASGAGDAHSDPTRGFDFWVGEWSVQNRGLRADGSWQEQDVTRARITPVCAGRAILEEWAGPLRGSFMNGVSLRAWNQATERWDLVLNWTTDGNGAFGLLHGNFRHGRGEFFSGSKEASWTRYTFSDALPESVRWDSATSVDRGVNWKTDWIMEFSRTRAAEAVTQDNLFSQDWNAGKLSRSPEARQLDGAVGSFEGKRTLSDGRVQEARLRSRLLNKDCILFDLFETRQGEQKDWGNQRICLRAWVPRTGRWEGWRLNEQDSGLKRLSCSFDGPAFVNTWDSGDGVQYQEVLVLQDHDHLILEESLAEPEADPKLIAVTELTRRR